MPGGGGGGPPPFVPPDRRLPARKHVRLVGGEPSAEQTSASWRNWRRRGPERGAPGAAGGQARAHCGRRSTMSRPWRRRRRPPRGWNNRAAGRDIEKRPRARIARASGSPDLIDSSRLSRSLTIDGPSERLQYWRYSIILTCARSLNWAGGRAVGRSGRRAVRPSGAGAGQPSRVAGRRVASTCPGPDYAAVYNF